MDRMLSRGRQILALLFDLMYGDLVYNDDVCKVAAEQLLAQLREVLPSMVQQLLPGDETIHCRSAVALYINRYQLFLAPELLKHSRDVRQAMRDMVEEIGTNPVCRQHEQELKARFEAVSANLNTATLTEFLNSLSQVTKAYLMAAISHDNLKAAFGTHQFGVASPKARKRPREEPDARVEEEAPPEAPSATLTENAEASPDQPGKVRPTAVAEHLKEMVSQNQPEPPQEAVQPIRATEPPPTTRKLNIAPERAVVDILLNGPSQGGTQSSTTPEISTPASSVEGNAMASGVAHRRKYFRLPNEKVFHRIECIGFFTANSV